MNVLVIEDDKRIASLVERALLEEGHTVTLSHNGRDGAHLLLAGKFEAALLDVLLPGMGGLEILETVRERRCKTPILMLTAVDAVPQIVRAFDLGADDYLVKPFILEILLARLSAIARRLPSAASERNVTAGGITLDRGRRIASYDGRDIPLTRKQFELLEVLMRRAGLITTREELIEAAWGYVADVKENTLDVYIHGLRAKLDDLVAANAESVKLPAIRTIHGEGYMFVAA
jgi:two-component system copper resistance phosphate regulon response regulator CusR